MDAALENTCLVDCLAGAHAKLRIAFQEVRIKGYPPAKLLFLAKFLSIHSGVSEFVELFKIKQYNPATLVFRSIFEAFVDLINIKEIEGYSDRSFLTNDISRLKMLSGMVGESRSLKDAANDELARLRKSIAEYKGNGCTPLTAKEKFSLAKLDDHYLSSYSIISALAHSDFYAIFMDCNKFDCPILDVHYHRNVDHKMNRACIEIVGDVMYRSAIAMDEYIAQGEVDALNLFKIEWLHMKDIVSKSGNESFYIPRG